MKAFIMSAGEGTRMRPLTAYRPKPLLPVAGKPILKLIIDNLEGLVDEVIVLVGWKGKKIKQSLNSTGIPIRYVRQEKALGTADAVDKAKEYVDENFLCLNGDVILSRKAIESFVDDFRDKNHHLMGLARVDDPSSYGVIETKGDMIRAIIEKPKHPSTDTINAGIYGFTPDVFSAIEDTERSPRGEYEITDTFRILMEREGVYAHEIRDGHWIELSRPWDLLDANERVFDLIDLEEKREGHVEDGVHIEGWVSIDDGARVRRGSYIVGPVCIGKDSDIGPNCFIRPCTSIGDRCRVGNAVEIKNSIIMDDTNIPHHNYVGDSVIGSGCNFGSGTKVANLRLDDANIYVYHDGNRLNTGRRKLGVIMGNNVKTGINSIINPGAIIGQDTYIGPGAVAKGEIGPKSRIR